MLVYQDLLTAVLAKARSDPALIQFLHPVYMRFGGSSSSSLSFQSSRKRADPTTEQI